MVKDTSGFSLSFVLVGEKKTKQANQYFVENKTYYTSKLHRIKKNIYN